MTETWTAPQAERTDPGLILGERQALETWLDFHRDTLLLKCAGLTADQLKERAVPPSRLSLLGLVRHLTEIERDYLVNELGGVDHGFVYTDDDEEAGGTRAGRGRPTTVLKPVGARANGDVRVHLVIPKSFNDAQQIADKFKDSVPVILNLQSSDTDLSKRLIDFASGLTYALDGGMQRIADKVFLLTPQNVEVSAEERARLIEKGFFNQS